MSRWVEYDVMHRWGPGTTPLPQGPGVYVIYFGDSIVYIGQSWNVGSRIGQHQFRFGYGKFLITPWTNDVPHTTPVRVKVCASRKLGDWAMQEIRLIQRLQPVYNRQHMKRRAA